MKAKLIALSYDVYMTQREAVQYPLSRLPELMQVSWRGPVVSVVFQWASVLCIWRSFLSNLSQRLCLHAYKWHSHPGMWPHSCFQSQYLLSLNQVPDRRVCGSLGCIKIPSLCCRKAGGISCLKVKVTATGRVATVYVFDSVHGLHCMGVLWLYAWYLKLRPEKLIGFKSISVACLPSVFASTGVSTIPRLYSFLLHSIGELYWETPDLTCQT